MATASAADESDSEEAGGAAESPGSRWWGIAALWAGLLVRLAAGVLALSTFLPLWLATCTAGGVVSLLGLAQLISRGSHV